MNMILNHSLHDILKPFQGVLDSLASRQAAKKQAAAKSAETNRRVPNIRRKTSQDFDMWDRLKDALHGGENNDALNNAAAEENKKKAEQPSETPPNPLPLEKIRANLGRAKKTTTRMRVIEDYLHPPESPAIDWMDTHIINKQ